MFSDLGFELLVAAGQSAQHVTRRGSRVDHRARYGCAGLEELTIAEHRELFTRPRWSVHDDRLRVIVAAAPAFTAVSLATLISRTISVELRRVQRRPTRPPLLLH